MSGAIPPLLQYVFMAWCSVKAQGQLYLYLYLSMTLSRGTSGSVLERLRAGRHRGSIPGRGSEGNFFCHSVQIGCGAQPVSYPVRIGVSFRWDKAVGA
jgi:hypothetical protein